MNSVTEQLIEAQSQLIRAQRERIATLEEHTRRYEDVVQTQQRLIAALESRQR